MKVWIVEIGEYSDRFVDGVYSTEENAKIAADGRGDVTEYDLDAGMSRYQLGMRVFSVQMNKDDGAVTQITQSRFMPDDANFFRIGISSPPNNNDRWVWDQLSATVWARSEEHAIKIVNDERARLIASGEWDSYQEARDKERSKRIATAA